MDQRGVLGDWERRAPGLWERLPILWRPEAEEPSDSLEGLPSLQPHHSSQ